MPKDIASKDNAVEIGGKSGQSIKFDITKRYFFNLSDFNQCEISGYLDRKSKTENKNFQSCTLKNMNFNDLSLNSSDFLDSYISHSRFNSCNMKGSHFNTCEIVNTSFAKCNMEWSNHNNTIFRGCIFTDCTFENILIKKCEFTNCKFVRCASSNKLFESCIILNCMFDSIILQVQTVSENIGLRESQFLNSGFRKARRRDSSKVYSISELARNTQNERDLLESFSWAYFFHGMDSSSYDIAFKLTEDLLWLQGKVPSSLVNRIENFVSFMQYLYEEDNLMVIVLLRLRDFFTEICGHLKERDEFSNRQIIRSFDGIRLLLSRYTDEFLQKLSGIISYLGENSRIVYLEAQGPIDKEYFEQVFTDLTRQSKIFIKKVAPKNSPIEVTVQLVDAAALWVFVATVLSTRIKYDFTREYKIMEDSDSAIGNVSNSRDIKSVTAKSISLFLGPLKTPDNSFGIRYLSVFSNGITKQLEISFSARRALEIHRSILKFVYKGSDIR